MAKIGGTAQLVFLIFAFATIWLIYKFIEYFSKNIELSWLVFVCIGPYFLSTFNGVRQWLAVALFAYSLIFVKERKLKYYLLFNTIGFLFHYSAIILLPFYWIIKSKKFNVLWLVACYFAFLISARTGLVDIVAEELHAASYLTGANTLMLDWAYYFFLALSIGFMVVSAVGGVFNDDEVFVWKNINMLSGLTVFLALTTTDLSNIIFTRFNMYFFIGYLVLIPATIEKVNHRFVRPLATVGIVLMSTMYYLYVTSTSSDLLPYQMSFDLFTWLGE